MAVRPHPGSAKRAKAKLNSWLNADTPQSSQPPAETGKMDRKL